MIRISMRPALIRTIRARSPDIPIEKLPHGWCAHQSLERLRWKFTILIVNAASGGLLRIESELGVSLAALDVAGRSQEY